MKKLIMLKGLPASGKSTYARTLLAEYPDTHKRVNKDDLRAMLDNGKWSKSNEEFVLKVRDLIIIEALKNNKTIIVDDTNLSLKHEANLRAIAATSGAKFVEKIFDTPLEECIERDLARGDKAVGKKVVYDMYNRYLRPPYDAPKYDANLDHIIICDIDGTLAHMDGRGPFDWDKVGTDLVDEAIRLILDRYDGENKIVLISGRDSVCRKETEAWLLKHSIPYDELHMRPEGNTEKDSIIKERIYEKHIKGKYNVLFVLDDRKQVVDMWRSKGLKCLQVQDGNF